MSEVVERALADWGVAGAAHRLVAARENAVYEVEYGDRRAALRLHRRGYRTDAELSAELAWMAAVASAGVSVPSPIAAPDGARLRVIDGVQVDMLTWLPGETMTKALSTRGSDARAGLFHSLGAEMARLHDASDIWRPPADFVRAHWDREGLLGAAPLWDRFWENPALAENDRRVFADFRDMADERLAETGPSLDYGLIHADLVPDNVLVDGETLRLIDFDDGGFGFRLFEIATALVKHLAAPDYPALREATLSGYGAIRTLDMADLDFFIALRAATYVGWNISRMDEPGGAARNGRFIGTLRGLIDRTW